MTHTFIVTVDTDTGHVDAPDSQTLANEIQSCLEYDAYAVGITDVRVIRVARNYRLQVERSYEQ